MLRHDRRICTYVNAGPDFARATLAPASFRLTVACFNRRATTVYERAGFRSTHNVSSWSNSEEREFLVMVRPANAQ